MMTEDEAREKWCPFVRIALTGTGYDARSNRDGSNDTPRKNVNCIASECMAWRWELVLQLNHENPGLTDWRQSDRGYCGLASKP